MGSKGERGGWKGWLKGFVYAFSGIKSAIRMERNLKVHLAAAILVIALAFVFHVSYFEKLILLILIGIVISLELINTSIEHTVNLATDEHRPLAKLAKDTAAGAVLFFSITAAVIGVMIFWHNIW